MPLAFLFAGGIPWRLIGIIAGVVALVAICFEIEHIGHLEAQLDAATQIANDNATVADRERQDRAKADKIAAQAQADADAARKKFAGKKRSIADAPTSDDGPLAPVLRRTLDGLPSPNGNEAGSGSSDAAAGKPHTLSGRPG